MSLEQQFSKAKAGDLGIIGDPVDHSLSPVMQNAALKTWKMAFEDRELPAPTYHKFCVRPEQLKESIELIKKIGLRGVNVTVPHKVEVGQYVDQWDPFSKSSGAINTLLLNDGKVKGFNTDGDGFRRVLERDMDVDMDGKSALVLGAGGTGKVIARQLAMMGAHHVFIWNRNQFRLESLMSELGDLGDVVKAASYEQVTAELDEAVDLIVNSTSVGLSANDSIPLPIKFRSDQLVFDVIYHRETEFMRQARLAGAHVFGGEGMLLYQGVRSFEIWTGTPAPIDLMRAALQSSLKGIQ